MNADLAAAVNPATGEVLEHLEQQPPAALAEALANIHAGQAELKRWGDALEGELRRRLKIQQVTAAVYGEWEVSAARGRESAWDAAELEPALQRLADEGVIRAGDWTGVITREPVVSKSKARDLLAQLDGDAAETVKACRTWKDKPGKLTVTRSVELAAPERPADQAPPAELAKPPRDFFRIDAAEPAAGEALPDRPAQETRSPTPPAPAGPPELPTPPPTPHLDPEELFA